MAEITLNGLRVTSVSLAIPRIGAWTADVAVDTPDAITGAAVLAIDGASWFGEVVRGGVYAGSWHGRIMGGSALLERLPATALRGATLALVLGEVLRVTGLSLASTSGALDAAAPRWHVREAPAAHVVGDVARAAGYAWRMLADGSLWLGVETWPTVTPAAPVDVIDEAPAVGRLVLAGDVLRALPGVTLSLPRRDPVRVGYVELRGTPDELRAVVLTEREGDPAAASGGRLLAAFEAIVARIMRRVDCHARYDARVVAQRADGTLDVVPDDARVPSAQAVPYRSLPGVAYEVPAGARALLGYVNGDPARPFVDLFEQGSSVTRIKLGGGTSKAARQGDGVSVTVPAGAFGSGIPSAPVTLTGSITDGSSALRLP